jgi:hypothetical protein
MNAISHSSFGYRTRYITALPESSCSTTFNDAHPSPPHHYNHSPTISTPGRMATAVMRCTIIWSMTASIKCLIECKTGTFLVLEIKWILLKQLW